MDSVKSPLRAVRVMATHSKTPSGSRTSVVRVRQLFAAETGNYFLLLGVTLFLVIFGLVMVLSSSSVTSFNRTDSFFDKFEKQGVFVLLGIPLMLIASAMPPRFWKRWANLGILIALGLQFLTVATPLGSGHQGNVNWIDLGPIRIQPSEIIKLTLALWLGVVLARKQPVISDWKKVAIPAGPVAGAAVGLVMMGHDLGTAIIITALILGALFFAGVRLRHLAVLVGVLVAATLYMSLATDSRQSRIDVWKSGCTSSSDFENVCWQTVHGWWALASGGVFGVGLGGSKAKWSWLPEADNDFIFAIIGEELGLVGAILVLVLYALLAIAFVRVIRANPDPFAKITVSAIMVWLISQALVNIAVVLGLLPVLGVPLPFMSAGGTALISAMVAVGVALSFARKPSATRHPTFQERS